MFEDAYRRACDAQCPALSLKRTVMREMEVHMNKTDPNETKRARRPRRRWPVCAAAAAAALALVLVITSLPWSGESAGVACAIAEPVYPAYPQRINAAHMEREDYYGEYRTYREALGLTEEFDTDFAAAVGDFSAQTSQILLAGGAENRIYSPVSFWIALGMLAETTGGESRQQILEALGVEDMETLRTGTQALWRRIYRDAAPRNSPVL